MKIILLLLFSILCLSCQSKSMAVNTALISGSMDQKSQEHSKTFEPNLAQHLMADALEEHQSEKPQLDPYQRKQQTYQPLIEERESRAIYIQLIKAIEQKDHMKVKMLKNVIITQYPQSSYAQRLNREGEGTMAAIAGVTTLFLTLTKLGLDTKASPQQKVKPQ